MGILADFQLDRMIRDFDSRFLVELGTDDGRDIEYAASFDFHHVYSVEKSHRKAIDVAFRNARNQRMTIVQGGIENAIPLILDEIPADASIIFWMDSHPIFDDMTPSSPLEKEFRLITSIRDPSRDIFLVDDLWRYEDGNFEEGACPVELAAPPFLRNLDFVQDILSETHQITRLPQRTGYLCAFPVPTKIAADASVDPGGKI